MAKRYLIETFGCQMNVHDSERMAGLLDQAGYEPTDDERDADIVVINTCSVREHAEEKLYTRLGELRVLGDDTGRRPIVAVAGFASFPHALLAIPVVVLIGLTFAALGLSVNALASGYDFFSYYMTLFLTPMTMLSGVFFPVEQLPAAILALAQALPLYHGVELVRALLGGTIPGNAPLHLAVLAAYALAAFYLATVLTRRRLLK